VGEALRGWCSSSGLGEWCLRWVFSLKCVCIWGIGMVWD
jgi:hypothetical protein